MMTATLLFASTATTSPPRRPAVAGALPQGFGVQPGLPRPTLAWPRLQRLLILTLLLGCGVLMVLYAVRVGLNQQLQHMGQSAKALHEENLVLEVELNRLRSYASLNADLGHMGHLVQASEKLQVDTQAADWQQPYFNGKRVVQRHTLPPPVPGF